MGQAGGVSGMILGHKKITVRKISSNCHFLKKCMIIQFCCCSYVVCYLHLEHDISNCA